MIEAPRCAKIHGPSKAAGSRLVSRMAVGSWPGARVRPSVGLTWGSLRTARDRELKMFGGPARAFSARLRRLTILTAVCSRASWADSWRASLPACRAPESACDGCGADESRHRGIRSRQRPDLDGSMPPPSHELAATVQKLCGVGLQPRQIRQSLAQQDQLIAFAQRSRFPANRVEHHFFTAIKPDEKARLHTGAIGEEHVGRCDEVHPDKLGRHRYQVHLVGVAPDRCSS